jgi:hypothetical protein
MRRFPCTSQIVVSWEALPWLTTLPLPTAQTKGVFSPLALQFNPSAHCYSDPIRASRSAGSNPCINQ